MSPHAARRRGRTNAPSPHDGGAVRLHIERLVLHGVARAESIRVAGALESELARLAAQPGPRLAPTDTVSLPAARVTAGPTPERTGRAVAGAVWSGIAGSGWSGIAGAGPEGPR